MWFLLLFGGFLAIIAAASESDTRRRALSPGKPPPKLLTSAAANVTALDASPGAVDGHTICQLAIPLSEEVFTPPLPGGQHLKLIFAGACAVQDYATTAWRGIDACYQADEHGNYRTRHCSLLIDGKPLAKELFEEDRAAHRYSVHYRSTGGRLAVLLQVPSFGGYALDLKTAVSEMSVSVVPLTYTELSSLGVDADERKREEELKAQALELATAAHLESNFLNEDYQHNYAHKHSAKIINTLSREWLTEYQRLLSDESLYTVIQEQHPHVLQIFEAKLEVVRIAERISVEPSPPSPEPKPRLSREDWQAKIEHHRQRMLDRLSVKAQDQIALMLQKFESAAHLRQRAEEMGLDEDIIERLTQELLGDLDQDEDTGSFKQV